MILCFLQVSSGVGNGINAPLTDIQLRYTVVSHSRHS